MQAQRNILITGSNRGLGYAIVESLCKNNPLNLNIILTTRNEQKGTETLNKLKQLYPSQSLEYYPLEVGNNDSHSNLVKLLQQNQKKIDILVNNAGIFYNDPGQSTTPKDMKDNEVIAETLKINYFGTIDFTKQMLSQLTDDAKILYLGSLLGTFQFQSKYQVDSLKENVTEEKLQQLADEYIQCGVTQNFGQETFLNTPYHASKNFLQTWTRFVGKNLLKQDQSLFVISPGWCRTEMGGQQAQKSIEEGISYPIELINEFPFATSDRNGELYAYGKYLEP